MNKIDELKAWLNDNCITKQVSLYGQSSFAFKTLLTKKQRKALEKLGQKYELKDDPEWAVTKRSVQFLMAILLSEHPNAEHLEPDSYKRLINFIDELRELKLDIAIFNTMINIHL